MFDEYATLVSDFYRYEFFNKFQEHYNFNHKLLKFQEGTIYKPFFKNIKSTGEFYSTAFYTEEGAAPVNLINTRDFILFPLTSTLNMLEDSYESLKYLNHVFKLNYNFFLNLNSIFFQPYSYTHVFDIFRADYDEFS